MKDYNFACGFKWVRNLVSDTKGETYAEVVWGQGTEEDIWTKDGWSDRRLEKTA
jgi:hypothetical protein